MEESFKIKTYGFGELAQLYFPLISKKSASWQLTKWINENKKLKSALTNSGKTPGQKLLTPVQVSMIVDEFGEP